VLGAGTQMILISVAFLFATNPAKSFRVDISHGMWKGEKHYVTQRVPTPLSFPSVRWTSETLFFADAHPLKSIMRRGMLEGSDFIARYFERKAQCMSLRFFDIIKEK